MCCVAFVGITINSFQKQRHFPPYISSVCVCILIFTLSKWIRVIIAITLDVLGYSEAVAFCGLKERERQTPYRRCISMPNLMKFIYFLPLYVHKNYLKITVSYRINARKIGKCLMKERGNKRKRWYKRAKKVIDGKYMRRQNRQYKINKGEKKTDWKLNITKGDMKL